MNILSSDAPVRGVFVMLDGAMNQYLRADHWVLRGAQLSIRRRISKFSFHEFSVFERFDQVGYMRDSA